MTRRATWFTLAALVVGLAARSQPAAGETIRAEGAQLAATIDPAEGFVDDALAFDEDGRLVYVRTDAAGTCELVVFDPARPEAASKLDISSFTTSPRSVEALADGRFFVVAAAKRDGLEVGALLDERGTIVRRFGPASDVVSTEYEGKKAVVTRDVGEDGTRTRYTVAVRELATGKRLGKKTTIEIDAARRSVQLDFTLGHWASNFTRVVGIKGGEWSRKENVRSPDAEGWYDLPARRFVRREPIKDVIAHRLLMETRAEHDNERRFVEVARDRSALLVHEGDSARPIELAEPFHHYAADSLATQLRDDGTLFISLTIHPVHPDAAARKRAVTPWMDLYRLAPGETRARRVARLLPRGHRELAWLASDEYWAILPRHIGFDRGGDRLLLYRAD